MNKIKKHLKDNIKIESKLELGSVKENLEFNKSNLFRNWNWKRSALLVPIMIALVLTFGLTRGDNVINVNALATVVTLDINPGIMISLDEDNEVIAVEALNADAEALLLHVDLTLTDLDELVAEIIRVADEQGFLLEDDTILFSVQSEDEELNDEIGSGLTETVSEAALELGKNLEAVVQKYKTIMDTATSVISQAKATLIEALLITGDYDVDDIDYLASLKVNEIKELLEEAYQITIQEIVSEGNDDNSGQTKVRERYVSEILELELLTIEEIAILETKDLKDVLKDYYKIAGDVVKDVAEQEVEETERQKYIETLSGLGILSGDELQLLDIDELEDLLEEYYDSIEDDEEAKEKANEAAQKAKEKAEKVKKDELDAEDDAEDATNDVYEKISDLEEEYAGKIAALMDELNEGSGLSNSGILEIEAEITELKLELESRISELLAELEEEVSEIIEKGYKDADKAEREAVKIAFKARKEYLKDLVKSINTIEQAEKVLEDITIEFETLIAELEAKLADSTLSEDDIKDLEDTMDDLLDDYEDLLEDVKEFINEFNSEKAEQEEKADEEAKEEEKEKLEEDKELDKESIKDLTTASGVEELTILIKTKYDDMINEIRVKLNSTDLSEEEIKELNDKLYSLLDDYEDLVSKLNDTLEDILKEESDSTGNGNSGNNGQGSDDSDTEDDSSSSDDADAGEVDLEEYESKLAKLTEDYDKKLAELNEEASQDSLTDQEIQDFEQKISTLTEEYNEDVLELKSEYNIQ